MVNPDQRRRCPQLGGPEPLPAPRRFDPGPGELGPARDSLAVVRVDRGREVRIELGVQRLGSALFDLPLDLLANLSRDRRAQVEVGQGGAQIEPGSPDHDRPPALGEQAVDLGVRELGEAAGAELLGHRHEAQQPVLEPRALFLGSPRR